MVIRRFSAVPLGAVSAADWGGKLTIIIFASQKRIL